MLTAWIMALSLSVWWEPDLFEAYWREVVVVEASLAFLVGALTARYWRSLAGGLAVSSLVTVSLVICSTQADSKPDIFFWNDRELWVFNAVANLLLLSVPLAGVASVGTLLNRRSIPCPALRYGLPVVLIAMIVLPSMTRAGAWDFERDTYSELVIQVIDASGRPLDDACFRFVPLYQTTEAKPVVYCTGVQGIPSQIALTSKDSNEHEYYRVREEHKPAGGRLKNRAGMEISLGDPGWKKLTIIYDCGSRPTPAPANPVAGGPY
jgi:hypothetical protein